MDTKAHLERHFDRAGIPIKVAERAFVRGLRGGGGITQIDIESDGKNETVRCFPGDGSKIQVLNVDKKHQQVIVSVTEPERTFQEKQYLGWPQRDPETGKRYKWVERVTPKEERRLLIGMDERHLFISQMDESNKPSSVAQAHESLAPEGIPGTRKRRKKAGIKRQGEWFLVPISEDERKQIQGQIKLVGVEKKVALGSDSSGSRGVRGKPHMVKERVRIGIKSRDEDREIAGVFRTVRRITFGWTSYVRGWVRHADHKTIKLRDWHRVESNREDRSVGTLWFD